MAKDTKSISEQSKDSSTPLKSFLADNFQSAFNSLKEPRSTWDDKESLFLLQNNEQLSDEYRSQVNDGRLSTLAWERSARVMAKELTGQVRAISKSKAGQSALMDLTLLRYIIPNANFQMDHQTKMILWNFYSSVYGTMPMLRFWRVSDTYVGPDSYLVPIRNFYPQPGKTSIEDSDWCMISTIMTVGQLKELAEDKTESWNQKAIQTVIDKVKDGKGMANRDSNRKSLVENTRQPNATGGKGDFAEVEVVHCFEAGDEGHWLSFCPDYDNEIIRDVENQHQDGQIPVTLQHCFPLIDSIIGLGDFERGKTLQFAMNSLVNLYLDSVKMKLFPPLLVDPNQAYMGSLEWQPGAVWKVKGPNAVKEFEFSPQGMNTFQSTYTALNAALQNQFGSTNADISVGDSNDPSFGKTPASIQMQQQRETARDEWARKQAETSIGKIYKGFVNQMAKQSKDSKDAIFHIFDDEIKELEKNPLTKDVMTVMEGDKENPMSAEVSVGNGKLKGDYDFIIDPGSTRKEDQKQAFQNLVQFFNVLPNLGTVLEQEGHRINWPWFIQQMVINSGVEGAAEELILPPDQAAMKQQEQQQQQNDPIKLLEAVNFKVEKLPAEVQQALYVQLADKFGLQLQGGQVGPTPDQQKLLIEQAKLDLAKQKQSFAEQVGTSKQNLAEQQHIAAQPNPGYAEPVHPMVNEMDKLAGFTPDPSVQQLADQQFPPNQGGQ